MYNGDSFIMISRFSIIHIMCSDTMPDLILLNVMQYALLGLTFVGYYYGLEETWEMAKFTFAFCLGIWFMAFCLSL